MTGDGFIKLGFWSQLIFLGLVDWGTIHAFLREGAAWYHWAGFLAVNLAVLAATWRIWLWLGPQRTPERPPIE